MYTIGIFCNNVDSFEAVGKELLDWGNDYFVKKGNCAYLLVNTKMEQIRNFLNERRINTEPLTIINLN